MLTNFIYISSCFVVHYILYHMLSLCQYYVIYALTRESLNFAVLSSSCIICLPSENSQHLSYASQLPTEDPDDPANQNNITPHDYNSPYSQEDEDQDNNYTTGSYTTNQHIPEDEEDMDFDFDGKGFEMTNKKFSKNTNTWVAVNNNKEKEHDFGLLHDEDDF